ncbi:MAG TPA: hypothetical protein VNZ52_06435, partial [Candidatus Thermoplasmatota archaeon]|nr:hypothetical protein [Candidatus Thermoplasmatota archaeon]
SDSPPPCFPLDKQIASNEWQPPGGPVPFLRPPPDQGSRSYAVPQELTSASIYVNYTEFQGSASFNLEDPTGDSAWSDSADVQPPSRPLGVGGDPPLTEQRFAEIPLSGGEWTLTWNHDLDNGRVRLTVIGHIRCDGASQQSAEGGAAGQ